MRFSYKAPYAGATLEVYVEVDNERGVRRDHVVHDRDRPSRNVSPVIDLPNLRDGDGRQWITIWIQPTDARGAWQVDDVMIDPWIAR